MVAVASDVHRLTDTLSTDESSRRVIAATRIRIPVLLIVRALSDARHSSQCADTEGAPVADTCEITRVAHICAVQLAYGEAQALDRVMYEEEVRREALSFEQQFHYGAGPRPPC